MRKEPFTVGNYVHVVKRGARGTLIVRNLSEKRRFLKMLRYLNSQEIDENWERTVSDSSITLYDWPPQWHTQRPLVKILGYCLMPNHFHLLLKEIEMNGISKFVKKISESMTLFNNNKYGEHGSIFQGAYRARTIHNNEYLRYVAAYILVKNPFELYAGGLREAQKNFEDAYKFSIEYEFCSLVPYAGNTFSQIIEKDILGEIFQSTDDFKTCARDMISAFVSRNAETDLTRLYLD